MDLVMVILRLLHIVAGVLWVGTAVFVTFILVPAIEEAGPAGMGVMPALARRGLMTFLPLLALITTLSGLGLFWKVGGGDFGRFMGSPMGVSLSVGATAALLAFLEGIALVRPTMMRAGAIFESLASLPADKRAEQLAIATALRTKGARAGRRGAVLLILAASAMAVARYL
jgi:uncharacterized membrane protein